jgi:hypothetical protein
MSFLPRIKYGVNSSRNPVFSLWARFHPRGGSTPEGGPLGPEAIWTPAFAGVTVDWYFSAPC